MPKNLSYGKDGTYMSSPRVKCTVDKCTHYLPGDYCQAAHIDIYNEAINDSLASSSSQTQCKSFHQRKTVGDMVGSLHNVNVGGLVSGPFVDGQQVTPSVQCFVNTCTHWSSGDNCHATEIQVKGMNAAQDQDTDCETFKPKAGK
jgi:Domain of Unknown Function (DUF1540)